MSVVLAAVLVGAVRIDQLMLSCETSNWKLAVPATAAILPQMMLNGEFAGIVSARSTVTELALAVNGQELPSGTPGILFAPRAVTPEKAMTVLAYPRCMSGSRALRPSGPAFVHIVDGAL